MAYATRAEQLEDLFEGFNGGWETLESALERHFTPDCAWANAGIRTTYGPQDALSLQREWGRLVGLDRVRIEVHRSVESGDTLLNERTDYIYDADGNLLFELEIAGVFVFEGDRIAYWREYFDSANAQNYLKDRLAAG
jgi:limonene-1,2-epoxide hydrolase